MSPSVVVVGSIVIDLPVWLARAPQNGETLKVASEGMFLGGKAVNQAVQAHNLGENPLVVGKVGGDSLGMWAKEALTAHGISVDAIAASHLPTSYAIPVIEPDRQYILHVAGANANLTESDVRQTMPQWTGARALLVQGEVPAAASVTAMRYMRSLRGLVVCDPAPVDGISEDMLSLADVLTPNEQELTALLAGAPHMPAQKDAARHLFQTFPRLKALIVTQGERGVWFQERSAAPVHLPSPSVHAVDPTAAGDSFNGTWIHHVLSGMSWREACRPAACAGALTASRPGAVASLPSQEEIERLCRQGSRQD